MTKMIFKGQSKSLKITISYSVYNFLLALEFHTNYGAVFWNTARFRW